MIRLLPASLITLSGACFVIASVAVSIPFWGHFRNFVVQESGHFGPWAICKDVDYGRKMCGQKFVMYKPTFVAYAAGVCATVNTGCLGVYGLFSVYYIYMTTTLVPSRRGAEYSWKYRIHILVSIIILSFAAVVTSWSSVGVFATEVGEHKDHGYSIKVGFSFYMEIVVGLFSTILLLLTINEYVLAKREEERFIRLDNSRLRNSNTDLNQDIDAINKKDISGRMDDTDHIPLFSSKQQGNVSNGGRWENGSRSDLFHPRVSETTYAQKQNDNYPYSTDRDMFLWNLTPKSKRKQGIPQSPKGERLVFGLGTVSASARRSPTHSQSSSRRGSKCNKYPDPLHFACTGDDNDDNSLRLDTTSRRSPRPSPSSSRRGSKCNKYPELLHFAWCDTNKSESTSLKLLAFWFPYFIVNPRRSTGLIFLLQMLKSSSLLKKPVITPVAVKVHNAVVGPEMNSVLYEELRNMARAMRKSTKHNNIVRFFGACILQPNTTVKPLGAINIVMEFCAKGSLDKYLVSISHNLAQSGYTSETNTFIACEQQLYRWAIEVASGMEYLSSEGLVHGDLAARNILLDENLVAKISDFGMSTKLYQYQLYAYSKQAMLPWRWMAPESFDRLQFSFKSDVWSYGVLLWELFSLGEPVWRDRDWSSDFLRRLQKGERLGKPVFATDFLHQTVLSECWKFAPNDRPTFSEISATLTQTSLPLLKGSTKPRLFLENAQLI